MCCVVSGACCVFCVECVVCVVLCVLWCVLRVACWVVVLCVLCAVWCLMRVVFCVLCGVWCVLCVLCCVLCVVCRVCVCGALFVSGACCVFWVETDKGSFILDNNYAFPVKPSELPYKWESMLCDGVWQQLHGFA